MSIKQSEMMESALKQAGVKVMFVRVPGGKHGPNFQLPAGDPLWPDYMGEAVRWTAMRPETRILYSFVPDRIAVLAARSAARDTGNQPRGSQGYQGVEPLGWLGFSAESDNTYYVN